MLITMDVADPEHVTWDELELAFHGASAELDVFCAQHGVDQSDHVNIRMINLSPTEDGVVLEHKRCFAARAARGNDGPAGMWHHSSCGCLLYNDRRGWRTR